MAPVVVAVAATGLLGAAGATLGLVTWTAVAFSTAATAVLQGVSYLMQKNTSGSSAATADAAVAAPLNADRAVPLNQGIPPRRRAYGQCRVGGAVFFMKTKNPKLYIGSLLSDGPCEAPAQAVYFGNNNVPLETTGAAIENSPYFERLTMEFSIGADTQTASPMLLAAFTDILDSNFRQRGVARAVVEMDWGDDSEMNNLLWGGGALPSFQGLFARVYDQRQVGQAVADKTTWTYSENPVLHTQDALLTAWGLALPASAINFDMNAIAANICDVTLTYNSNPVKTFTGAGIFQADVNLGQQIADMLSAYRGRLVYQDGKYGIVADAAQSSVWTVTDTDILEIGTVKHGADSNAYFGAVSAKFYDSQQGGVQDETPVYEAEAGQRETSVTLPFTDRSHSAQIIAFRELIEGRDGRSMDLLLTDAAIYLSPGERITIASVATPFINGEFKVEQVDLATPGVRVTLKGYTAAAYVDPATYLV